MMNENNEEFTIQLSLEGLPEEVRVLPATDDEETKYELFNEAEELINVGSTTLVFIDMQKNKPCLPPADFMEKLKEWFK